MSDILIHTWRDIGKYLGMSKRSVIRRRKKLLDGGYVFYRRRDKRDRNPVAAAWNQQLRRYIEDQAKKNELI